MSTADKYVKWRKNLRQIIEPKKYANANQNIDHQAILKEQQNSQNTKELFSSRQTKDFQQFSQLVLQPSQQGQGNHFNQPYEYHTPVFDRSQPSHPNPNGQNTNSASLGKFRQREPLPVDRAAEIKMINNGVILLGSQKFLYGPGRHDYARPLQIQSVQTQCSYPRYITIEFIPPHHMSLRFHRFYDETIRKSLRLIPGMQFNLELRAWINSKEMYPQSIQFLKPICQEQGIHLEEVPEWVLECLMSEEPPRIVKWNYNSDYNAMQSVKVIRQLAERMETEELDVAEEIYKQRYGRIVLEGQGNLQLVALAVSIVYKAEWPILIVTPNCMAMSWRAYFLQMIPQFDLCKIQVLTSKDSLKKSKIDVNDQPIVICPYQLLQEKEVQEFINCTVGFKVCIIDQVSQLKQQEQEVVTMLSNIKRVIAIQPGVRSLLKSPIELHNMLKLIRPDSVPQFVDYAQRYCDPKCQKEGVRYGGASYLQELKLLWRSCFSLRISTNLKNSQKLVQIAGNMPMINKIQETLTSSKMFQFEQDKDQSSFEVIFRNQTAETDFTDMKETFQKCLKLTSFAKLTGLFEYLDVILEQNYSPIIVYEHQHVLDSLQQGLDQRQVTHVDLSKYLLADDIKKRNQIINDLQMYGGMFAGGQQERKPDHLLVGFISYKSLQNLDLTNDKSFSSLINIMFDFVIFMELSYQTQTVQNALGLLKSQKSIYLNCQATLDRYIIAWLCNQLPTQIGKIVGIKQQTESKIPRINAYSNDQDDIVIGNQQSQSIVTNLGNTQVLGRCFVYKNAPVDAFFDYRSNKLTTFHEQSNVLTQIGCQKTPEQEKQQNQTVDWLKKKQSYIQMGRYSQNESDSQEKQKDKNSQTNKNNGNDADAEVRSSLSEHSESLNLGYSSQNSKLTDKTKASLTISQFKDSQASKAMTQQNLKSMKSFNPFHPTNNTFMQQPITQSSNVENSVQNPKEHYQQTQSQSETLTTQSGAKVKVTKTKLLPTFSHTTLQNPENTLNQNAELSTKNIFQQASERQKTLVQWDLSDAVMKSTLLSTDGQKTLFGFGITGKRKRADVDKTDKLIVMHSKFPKYKQQK